MIGALVAGNHAGLVDNTFPLMEGRWIPPGMGNLDTVLENPAAIQFMHRTMAYAVTLAVAMLMAAMYRRRQKLPLEIRQRGLLVLAVFVLQFTLGVLTLLHHVPIVLASLHQVNAVLFFALSVWLALDFDSHPQHKDMRGAVDTEA